MKKCFTAASLLILSGSMHAQESAPLQAPATAETVELKPRWQAGKKYLQTLHSNMKTSQTIEKQLMDMTQDMTMGMVYEIKDIDAAGNANTELTFRSVRAKFHTKYGPHEVNAAYDSQRPSKKINPAMSVLAALIGAKVQMTMAPDGRLLKMKGLNEMRNRMLKALPIPPGADRAGFEAMMKKQLSDESIRKMIEQDTGFSKTDVYPGKSVAIGESWTRKITLAAPVPTVESATYTLRERVDGVAHIDVKARFSMTSDDTSPVKTIKVATKMSGNQTGTVAMRESDGVVMKMQTSLRFAGTVTSSGPASPNSKRTITKSWPIYAAGTVALESKDLP